MKKFLYAFIMMMLIPVCMTAQDDVTKKDNNTNNTTVDAPAHQDNAVKTTPSESATEQTSTQETAAPSAPSTNPTAPKTTGGSVRAKRPAATPATGTVRAKRTPNGNMEEKVFEAPELIEFTKHRYVDGFRIQVCSLGNTNKDHEEVRNIGKKFKGYFRRWRVEVRQNPPRWTCLAGDFATREAAKLALKRVQNTHKFPSATIVRAKIKNARYKRPE